MPGRWERCRSWGLPSSFGAVCWSQPRTQGTGREGRKRRKSRNGCMVSTGFPVPLWEPELRQVQIAPAPAPGAHRRQLRGRDLAARTGWREGDPFAGLGGGHGPALLQGFSLCGDILPCMQPGSSTLLILAVPSLTGSAPRGQAWAEFGSCWPCHSSVRRDTSRLGTVPRGSVPCPPLAGLLPVPWPLGAVLPQCAQLPPARAQGVGQDRARAAGAPWGRCSQPHGTQQSGAGF